MTKDQVYFSRKELAERLRIPTQTLAAWKWRGRGPRAVLIGSLLRYPVNEVIAWERDPKAYEAKTVRPQRKPLRKHRA